MGIKVTGFDKLEKELNQLQRNAKKLEQTKAVSFEELFTTSFMQKYTNFSSFDSFLEAGKFIVNSKEDFEAIPDSEMDAHVGKTTNFSSWEDMLGESVREFTAKKLGF